MEKDRVHTTRYVPPLSCFTCDARKGGIPNARGLKTWSEREIDCAHDWRLKALRGGVRGL